MSAITDLDTLLGSMSPIASDGRFVFCCIADGRYGVHADLAPLASFQEKEGLTLILPQPAADRLAPAPSHRKRCCEALVDSVAEIPSTPAHWRSA